MKRSRDNEDDQPSNSSTMRKMSKLAMEPVGQFDTCPIPNYRQPIEVGCYSLDIHKAVHLDRRALRTYSRPDKRINLDLSVGYDEYIEKEGSDYLDHILTWITSNKSWLQRSPGSEAPARLPFDFITFRGQLTKIMCTPYDRKDSWRMALSLWNGTIYMTEIETEQAQQQKQKQTERQKLMCYWGRKFEDYCSEQPHGSGPGSRGSNPVNNLEAFCSVVTTKINDFRILIAGEVDCMKKESREKPPGNYIELKTSRQIENRRQENSFKKFKLLRWWSQSYLLGVPEVIAGFRDDNGFVKSLKSYKTLEIPRLVKHEKNMWSASLCLNFMCKLFSWIQSIVTKDSPNVVYMMDWQPPFTHVTIEEQESDEFVFLRPWFIKSLESVDQASHKEQSLRTQNPL